MRVRFFSLLLVATMLLTGFTQGPRPASDDQVFGFRDFSRQAEIDRKFNQSPDPKRAEYMVFPRLCALAEVLWTPREARDYTDFTRRLAIHLERLAVLDVNYRPVGN